MTTDSGLNCAMTGRLRIILDPNVYISKLISTKNNTASVVEDCIAGKHELLYSERLLEELEDVINRDKFRRWFSVEEGLRLIDAIVVSGIEIEDRSEAELPNFCTDPDDNYLFALYEDGNANLLVSGDKRVRAVRVPGVTVTDPATAAEHLQQPHPWGVHILPGRFEEAREHIEAAGQARVFDCVDMLLSALAGISGGQYDPKILSLLVVPGTDEQWIEQVPIVQKLLEKRAYGNHPIFIAPDLVAIKLVPDPGQVVVTLNPPANLTDIWFLTLERCEDILGEDGVDELDLDGWRAHSITQSLLLPEQIRPPDDPFRKTCAEAIRRNMHG